MEKEMQELKSVLRSLVVSSPAQVDVRALQRDYRAMMGSAIPVHKYGYRDVLAFLKERCADCFLFHGVASNPVLTLIVPDSLKHIDQFVQRQKPSAITKMKGKRRSVVENVSRPPEKPKFEKPTNLIAETFSRNQATDIKRDNEILTRRSVSELNKPLHTNSTTTLNNMCYDKRDTVHRDIDRLEQKKVDQNGYESNNVRNFLKKRLPMFDSAVGLDSEEAHELHKQPTLDDDDSGRQTASSGGSRKRLQLERVTSELLELLRPHPHGVLVADIMRLYREQYGRELDLARAGFYNLTGLLGAVDERLAFYEGPGGTRVRDARAPPPAHPPPRPAPPACPPPPPVDPEDALPGVPPEAGVVPDECLQYLESIPAASVAGLRAGAMLEVAVGEVYSPSHFWLQRLGAAHAAAMHALMDDMTAYYGRGAGRPLRLARAAVREGQYCAAIFEGDWHRALVVKIVDADTVKVLHVDYGTVDAVSWDTLKPLRREYAALPAQAVRARLAGLRPGAGGRRWPHAASAHFLHLVCDKHFVANVVAVNEEENELETLLIDTSGEDDVCVTAELVRAGHADRRADSALASGESYLLPAWAALERGATLNYGEIQRCLADGIALEFVPAYRQHVPAALPPAPAPALTPAAPALLDRVPLLRLDSPPPPAPPVTVPAARVALSPPAASCLPSPPVKPSMPAPLPVHTEPSIHAVPPPAGMSPALGSPLARGIPAPPGMPPPPGITGAGAGYGPPPELDCWAALMLSAAEREVYELLRFMDPAAAHCYILSALRRRASPPGPRPAPNV